MNELALFAGAGGGILGSVLLGHRIVCAVEAEPYRREVLLRRQRDGLLPMFPIWDDIRTFDGTEWRGAVDLISAGFPCQPFSVAGKQHGELDERNLWPDTARIIREVRPRFAFLENVPGLLADEYFGNVLGDLAACGYDAEWTVLGADDCGAPHRRKRLWILAHAETPGFLREVELENRGASPQRRGTDDPHSFCEEMAHTGRGRDDQNQSQRLSRCGDTTNSCTCGSSGPWCHDPADVDISDSQRQEHAGEMHSRLWQPGERTGDREAAGSTSRRLAFPSMGRVAHGVAHRVDRLAALGDGQVPIVAATAFRLLMERIRT